MQTPPSSADWSAVKALFEAAQALPAADREGFVRSAGAGPEVEAEVLSLLAHSTEAFLAQPAAHLLGAQSQPSAGHPGERLGPWRLVHPLGSGGMGEVWLAERADGAYTGEAAVKLLKRGMDSAAVLQRFAQERQALARLDHAHIARLFDAGLSPQGLPYFVMERVQGQSIDQAAAALPLEGKLALFLQLTDAVAHAHRHLLVHRDLKPSNVLVNDEGQVKLLDFGIAKALDPLDDPGAPEQTLAGQRPFTPTHASPEQVRGEPVSTATDVYSLGVLLYQLLTGQRPYGRDARSPAEAAQAVLNEAPTRPSALTLPSNMGANAQDWLSTRQRLQGDLDNILLKALEKDVPRRYASVDQFAADLRATLAGYPVSARAPSRGYLLSKFVQRNRVTVGLGATAVLALLTGLALAAWQAHVARQARQAAELRLTAVKGITADLVFRFGDAITYLPGGRKAQDKLLEQTLSALSPLVQGEQPDSDLQALSASILARRAELLGNDTTGTAELAAETDAMAQRAIALGERLWSTHQRDWRFAQWHARVLQVQSVRQRNSGQPEAAEATIRQAIARLEVARPHAQPDLLGRAALGVELANTTLSLAQTLSAAGRMGEALVLYAKAEPVYRDLLDDKAMQAESDRQAAPGDIKSEVYLRHQLGVARASRALTLIRLDRLDEALTELQATLPLRRANVAADPDNIAWHDGLMQEANTLSLVQLRLGQAAAALAASTLAWEENERLARQEGPKSKWATMPRTLALQHGRALWATGQPEAALAVVSRGMALWQATRGTAPNPGADVRWSQLQALQGALLHALRRPGAEAPLRAALARLQGHFGDANLGRSARLAWAEAAAWLAPLNPNDADSLRRAASQALDEAAATMPLAADHRALRDELERVLARR
ncbi:serine/threonine-protein kinase [Inhella crocodyli]|uniref:Serine/threonine protein kinase n=1 Tax=Inhella crocodyli TaxID=2499851 RepID=A0A437LKQ6_9BURK|nr:serine/threonine-protein kinase [Inhella crocodyli]RVT85999.1 serine/threonine protein kinase [Inhella crocodyli]